MEVKQRKIIIAITIFYAIVILYLMFFGFGRIDASKQTHEYTFMWLPDSVFSLRFPRTSDLRFSMIWLFNFSNVAAFIPFGVLIPWLFRLKFLPFISLFLAGILLLETLQALTFLGSFDINDAIQNSIGAAIGYGAMAFGFRASNIWSKLARTGMLAVVLTVAFVGFSEAVTATFAKKEGPAIALTDLPEANGQSSAANHPQPFAIGGEKIVPQLNLYAIEGKKTGSYTYRIGGKEGILAGYYGLPDQASKDGKITIFVNGSERLTVSNENGDNQINEFELPLEKTDELTVTLEGDEKLWDVTFKEMKHWWE
ncbi:MULTISPECIES: VanZ family protein [Paenibacillus]|uniref:VanZ-like domain-containing protein n=1 Tax=Paenibacillus albilobatus TaxID=2716884 RepID=A0A919XH34_9BACL|nr:MULTISPECIES: VanZ family protein [Paenibacillus]GIO31268.1 hypothetical protein J2TS6_24090 [Paenibacillus albilobatus]